jgi:hypothetical protein
MAIVKTLPEDYELQQFLKAWGIDPEGFSSAMITIDDNSIVTVAVIHRKELDDEMVKKAKRYALVELKNE